MEGGLVTKPTLKVYTTLPDFRKICEIRHSSEFNVVSNHFLILYNGL